MINKNLIKIIGGGILVTTIATISIIGAVVSESKKKKAEKPNYGIYSDGYFNVVDTIVDSSSIPIYAKSDLIKAIPHYKENGFYNAIISIINSSDLPDKLKFDTIMGMCGK